MTLGVIDRDCAPQHIDGLHNPDTASVAEYIADMCIELADLAGKANQPMLAYFLNLARVEAGMHVRSFDWPSHKSRLAKRA
jgi:hypothetical protein